MNNFISDKEELKPRRSTKGSAGYDFIAPHDFIVPAHGVSDVIDSEVSVKLDSDKVLLLYVRSSYGFKYGITLANGTGVIDSDFYPHTMKCKLVNSSDKDFVVKKGDKYMQGIIMSYYTTDDDECDSIRNGGIGSTGN